MTKREEIVSIMQGWVGQRISDGTPSEIVDLYNSEKPLARGYKVKYTDNACAATVSAAAIKAGIPRDIFPRECGCGELIELFRAAGVWQEADTYVPLPGDLIFYDWDDGANYASTDDKGWPEHVGIVEAVANGLITVIEGNKSRKVDRRTLEVNGRYIRGFGTPKYPSDRIYEPTIINATADIGMIALDFWQDVLDGKQTASGALIRAVLDRYHAKLTRK
jgi:hypothetical protein